MPVDAMRRIKADFRVEQGEGGHCLILIGDWTAEMMGRTPSRLVRTLSGRTVISVNSADLDRVDTAGAYVLVREAGVEPQLLEASSAPGRVDLGRLARLVAGGGAEPVPADPPPRLFYRTLVRIGRGAEDGLRNIFLNVVFYGQLLSTVGRVIVGRRAVRLASTVSLMERAGLDALPIVVATNFFVGATIAFLGANLLAQFGASIFTVELVGVGVLREFAVLITAVILAGRSASSFAAEIGAMKMNQEVDAMEVMGVDPFDALVLPRFLAMLTMTPLLTFAAMIAGMAGGVMVIWAVLDLSPALFLSRLVEHVGVRHFWIGLVKSPVMAVVVAAIGCREGLEVGGDVEQLGRRVTSAVVQALFAIIVIDALFALLFLELNL